MDENDKRAYTQRQLIDAMQSVAPEALAKLGIDPGDKRAQLVITELCIAIFNAGIRAGASEAIAQAVEQGLDVTVQMDANLLPPTSE